jgi:hypothetical protein
MDMARPKREGYTRRNIMSNDVQHKEINEKILPYEGLKDFSAFIEAACARFIEEIKAKRKAAKK